MQRSLSMSTRTELADPAPPRRSTARSDTPAGRVVYSVVIPVYGSEFMLPELHRRLTVVLQGLGEPYEIIFVDDCGPDNAWVVLQELAAGDPVVTVIQLMRNVGQANATLCGLAQAMGQFVLTMDDDLQHPPEEIPLLVAALQPQVDVVMGAPEEKQHHWLRCLGSSAMHTVNSWLLGKDRRLRFTSFRLMRRPVVDGLLTLRTLSPALGPMLHSITTRIVNVRVQHAPRGAGQSGYTLGRLFAQTLSNLIGSSMLPLRLLALVGGAGIGCSLVFAIVLLARYLAGGITVPGWTTLALLLVLLSGFNFFAFALLGEYVLRILQRVNATPQYLVRTLCTSDTERTHVER